MFHGRLPGFWNPRTPTKYPRYILHAMPGINLCQATPSGLNPVTVLPFDYGVPELVKRQEFGGSVTSPGECQTSRNSYHPACPLAQRLFPEPLMSSAPDSSGRLEPAADRPPQRIPHWLVRTELYLRVLLRMYIGLAICYAPWSQLFWDQNPIFVQFPTLAIYAANGASARHHLRIRIAEYLDCCARRYPASKWVRA